MAELAMQQIITTVAGMAATGVIGYLAATVKKHGKVEKARTEIEKATARQDIFDAFERYVVRGEHMTIARYDEIIREYDAYKVLGGNGTAEAYMDEIRKKRPYLVTE